MLQFCYCIYQSLVPNPYWKSVAGANFLVCEDVMNFVSQRELEGQLGAYCSFTISDPLRLCSSLRVALIYP